MDLEETAPKVDTQQSTEQIVISSLSELLKTNKRAYDLLSTSIKNDGFLEARHTNGELKVLAKQLMGTFSEESQK
jgi:hypothetical protein